MARFSGPRHHAFSGKNAQAVGSTVRRRVTVMWLLRTTAWRPVKQLWAAPTHTSRFGLVVVMPVTFVAVTHRKAARFAELRTFGKHAFGDLRHVRNKVG